MKIKTRGVRSLEPSDREAAEPVEPSDPRVAGPVDSVGSVEDNVPAAARSVRLPARVKSVVTKPRRVSGVCAQERMLLGVFPF